MTTVTKYNDFMSDRYHFDCRACTPAKGWAQIDTAQDAPYYGTWTNPITFELVNYCEGDVTHTNCKDADEYKVVLAECISWNKERGYFIGVDCMGRADIADALDRLGFAADVHGRPNP